MNLGRYVNCLDNDRFVSIAKYTDVNDERTVFNSEKLFIIIDIEELEDDFKHCYKNVSYTNYDVFGVIWFL